MALYLDLKNRIYRGILDKTYGDGQPLPPELTLCKTYGVSRVTVRKALEELKREGVLHSVQGQGTRVTFNTSGYRGSMETIILFTEAHHPFFTEFHEAFERNADEQGSLVLLKHDHDGKILSSDTQFIKLIQRGFRNVIIWPRHPEIDLDLLRRVRSVGCNIVFFDQNLKTDFADVVTVDNAHAVTTLYKVLKKQSKGPIVFIGFENLPLPSEWEREQAFLKASNGAGRILRVPWCGGEEPEIDALFDIIQKEKLRKASFLCVAGNVATVVARRFRAEGKKNLIATVDASPQMKGLNLWAYEQPMARLAAKSFERLRLQNEQEKSWKPGVIKLKGRVIQP